MTQTVHAPVLLVEDDAAVAEMYRLGLELAGFGVVVAWDGPSALLSANEGHGSDVVILDLTLPGMDGLDVLAALQRTPLAKGIPVIVLSNRTQDFAIASAVGAVRCLTKAATTPQQLVDCVASVARPYARGA